jgi:hypothetical protein
MGHARLAGHRWVLPIDRDFFGIGRGLLVNCEAYRGILAEQRLYLSVITVLDHRAFVVETRLRQKNRCPLKNEPSGSDVLVTDLHKTVYSI